MIDVDGPHLLQRGAMHRWSMDGYATAQPPPERAWVLTPRPTVQSLSAGYRPQIHGTLDGVAHVG